MKIKLGWQTYPFGFSKYYYIITHSSSVWIICISDLFIFVNTYQQIILMFGFCTLTKANLATCIPICETIRKGHFKIVTKQENKNS